MAEGPWEINADLSGSRGRIALWGHCFRWENGKVWLIIKVHTVLSFGLLYDRTIRHSVGGDLLQLLG